MWWLPQQRTVFGRTCRTQTWGWRSGSAGWRRGESFEVCIHLEEKRYVCLCGCKVIRCNMFGLKSCAFDIHAEDGMWFMICIELHGYEMHDCWIHAEKVRTRWKATDNSLCAADEYTQWTVRYLPFQALSERNIAVKWIFKSFFFKRDGILHQAKKEFIRRSKPDLRVAVPSFVFGLNLFRGIE